MEDLLIQGYPHLPSRRYGFLSRTTSTSGCLADPPSSQVPDRSQARFRRSLHAMARLHRNERRGNHNTFLGKLSELPVRTVAAGAGLIAEAQAWPILAEPFDQLDDVVRPVRKDTEVTHLAAAPALGNYDRDGCLLPIQSHVRDGVHLARPPCLRLGAGHPAQPSIGACRGGPPALGWRTSSLDMIRRRCARFNAAWPDSRSCPRAAHDSSDMLERSRAPRLCAFAQEAADDFDHKCLNCVATMSSNARGWVISLFAIANSLRPFTASGVIVGS